MYIVSLGKLQVKLLPITALSCPGENKQTLDGAFRNFFPIFFCQNEDNGKINFEVFFGFFLLKVISCFMFWWTCCVYISRKIVIDFNYTKPDWEKADQDVPHKL